MKEFEKWLKSDSLEDGTVYDCYHNRDCRKAWKAALEWVLTLKQPDHTDLFEEISPILIEKELQDE